MAYFRFNLVSSYDLDFDSMTLILDHDIDTMKMPRLMASRRRIAYDLSNFVVASDLQWPIKVISAIENYLRVDVLLKTAHVTAKGSNTWASFPLAILEFERWFQVQSPSPQLIHKQVPIQRMGVWSTVQERYIIIMED